MNTIDRNANHLTATADRNRRSWSGDDDHSTRGKTRVARQERRAGRAVCAAELVRHENGDS